MGDSPVVLHFHDSLIRTSDINILEGPEWLNDHLIGFFFQYLEKTVYASHEKHVAFIGPEVTQCIKLSRSSEVGVFVEPLNLNKKSIILLPVNDCVEEFSPGGTHWSLLVFVRDTDTFLHYDSCSGSNMEHARGIVRHILPFVKSSVPFPYITPTPCVQQINSYDCGIHVICNAEFVCRKYLNRDKGDVFSYVTAERVAGKRLWLKNLILSLRDKR